MNYLQSIAYIESLTPTATRPLLERMDLFMRLHGSLQDKLSAIHVGGTNGKGSVVAMIDAILQKSGMKTGRYIGPHLLRFNERIYVAGSPIADDDFAKYATQLREMSEEFGKKHSEFGMLTWFEFLTALAFFYFVDKKVDVAVVEVGLGGRYDATNVMKAPKCSVITNVDLDHTHLLGKSIAEIAQEKSGIVKPRVPLVTGCEGEALEIMQKAAEAQGCSLIHCRQADASERKLALAGDHQKLNAYLALSAIEAANLNLGSAGQKAEAIEAGLAAVYWPGRLQYLPKRNLILDGAHNPAGARALKASLAKVFADKRRLFVLACFDNKDVAGVISGLIGPGDQVFVSEPNARRPAFPSDIICSLCQDEGAEATSFPSIGDALRQALLLRRPDQVVIACGSLACVKEAMQELGWQNVEDGREETLLPDSCSSFG